jgi:hypothetical protein
MKAEGGTVRGRRAEGAERRASGPPWKRFTPDQVLLVQKVRHEHNLTTLRIRWHTRTSEIPGGTHGHGWRASCVNLDRGFCGRGGKRMLDRKQHRGDCAVLHAQRARASAVQPPSQLFCNRKCLLPPRGLHDCSTEVSFNSAAFWLSGLATRRKQHARTPHALRTYLSLGPAHTRCACWKCPPPALMACSSVFGILKLLWYAWAREVLMPSM